jgi:hypothetical protein
MTATEIKPRAMSTRDDRFITWRVGGPLQFDKRVRFNLFATPRVMSAMCAIPPLLHGLR